MSIEQPARFPRNLEIDQLRAVAVLLVIGTHIIDLPTGLAAPVDAVLRLWMRCGWIGVDLFFVLSGFLVAGILFREHERRGRISVSRFLIRRGFKIYPSFYLFLLVTVLVGATPFAGVSWATVLPELLFFQSYRPLLWNHTWSLAVEEHFYLLLPGLLVLTAGTKSSGRAPFRSLPAMTAIVAVVCLAVRVLNAWWLSPYRYATHLFPTHLRIDSLLFGVLLAYAHYHHRAWLHGSVARYRLYVGLASGLCVIPSLLFRLGQSRFLASAGLTLLYLGFGGVLLLALGRGQRRTAMPGRMARALAMVGFHSYSIYLWHMPVRVWLVGGLPSWPPALLLALFVYAMGSVVVGITLSTLIEQPMLRLRDRRFPSLSSGAAPEPVGARD